MDKKIPLNLKYTIASNKNKLDSALSSSKVEQLAIELLCDDNYNVILLDSCDFTTFASNVNPAFIGFYMEEDVVGYSVTVYYKYGDGEDDRIPIKTFCPKQDKKLREAIFNLDELLNPVEWI